MTGRPWLRRFLVKGVFWRQLLRSAVLRVPSWSEPVVHATWALLFLIWAPGRRGVMRNLKAIKPGSTFFGNFFRAYRVFWNFAWSIGDNARFLELRTVPDWEFVGLEHFERLRDREGGAIILTAHMGSYDLGAHLFAETSDRRIVMVRAPEVDPETQQYEESLHERTATGLKIDFNTKASDLALDLLDAVCNGEIVAIQGDRITPGIASMEASLFGLRTRIPAGPFALAMASRAPIFPLFIIRRGRRCYRLLACEPIEVVRTSRDRDADLQRAIETWAHRLEEVVGEHWQQWFMFEPFEEERAA